MARSAIRSRRTDPQRAIPPRPEEGGGRVSGVVPRAAVLVALLAAAAPAAAQHEHAGGASPYAELLDREIKALSAEDVEQLRAGEGMGMALAAELNGLPGPRHVLDLADEIGLSPEAREEVRAVFDSMESRAVALGARIVEEERALDRAFASGAITPEGLEERTARIARLRGELRAVHLGAHLTTAALLSDDQRHRYAMLRGYHTGGA